MPEYLPPLQLPTGLAEQYVQLKSQAGNPWAALAQGLGQDAATGAQNYRARQANAPLTPEQTAAIQKGQVPGGLTREQGLSLAERQATQRAALGKTIVPVTDSVREIYKLSGHTLNPDDTQVSAREFDAFSKLAQNAQKASLKPVAAYDSIDGLVDGIHQFIASGGKEGTDPKDLPGYGGKNSLKAQALEAINKKYPNDFKAFAAAERGNKAQTAGATAGARFQESGPGQMVARVANSAMEQLDDLQKASDNFPRSDVKMLNTPIMKIDEQTMPEAQVWKIALNTARMEYAAALNRGNSPGLENIAEAAKALPDTITMKQLPGAIAQLRKGLTNTVKGMTTRIPPGGTTKEKTGTATKGASETDPLGLGL